MRAVGILVAIFFVAGSLDDFYALPVGIEFVGCNQRNSGAAAASHFAAVRDDENSSVGVDCEPNVGRKRALQSGRFVSRSALVAAAHHVHAQHKSARAEHSFEEPATADIFDANL